MAAGAYDPFARVLSFVAALGGDKPRHPDKFNPYRFRVKSAEAKRLEHEEAKLALRTGLRMMVRGR